MRHLKRLWEIYSRTLTMDFLERLLQRDELLGNGVKLILIGCALGVLSWYYLDQRFIMIGKDGSLADPTFRYVVGSAFLILAIVPTFYGVKSLRQFVSKSRAKPRN